MTNTPSTQKFVPVSDVKDNVLLLKNGQICMILMATSINFALKSSDEQRGILSQFQNFLNTLDFTLQIYIQSRRLNIEPYIKKIEQREKEQYNDLMRMQLREYIHFIQQFTSEVDIMTKNFFIVIPYNPPAVNVQSNLLSSLDGAKSKKTKKIRFQEHVIQLEQRVNIVETGLSRTGIHTSPLVNEELIELYYHIFNPRNITDNAPKMQT